jgi:type IV fimbrial biogenesis protein FimT
MRGIDIRRTPSGGFSLIEQLMTLAVVAILLGIGIPGFSAMLQAERVGSAANALFSAIRLTRSEAIRRGERVDLVPAGSSSDWAQGWIVFVDDNGDQQPGAGEKIIFRHDALASGIKVTSTLNGQYIAYNGTGRTQTNASSQAPQFGSLLVAQGKQARKLTINFLGRARVCNPAIDGNAC